ncbi:CBS domain-containing protein [Psychrobacillus psychrodurans]|uniref:CBS domain-containing protein n=1 Tax=Psychrobacillus psychrodurans TaxID=126157 RepID=A0A9X3LAH0_9BACI|nr:CBS domain-containing protein [Psychrobacillus psychrodurans]MCK1997149.1 CBS domain-containing protein [Psychrobacillus psychrodurans]MCZ8534356.1 CBS domain-containing protein [Psychrobacillus psychrodurans]MCZ8541138.1 CBS domain-containing protein [Psychrobacillus psychrodurans]
MNIKDVMSKEVVTCNPQDYVSEVADQMRVLDIGCLPVVSNKKLVGMITDRDIVTRSVAKDIKSKVEDVMTKTVISVSPEDSTADASIVMARNQVRRLPVMEDGNLVGFVSLADLAFPFPHVQEISNAMESISEPR